MSDRPHDQARERAEAWLRRARSGFDTSALLTEGSKVVTALLAANERREKLLKEVAVYLFEEHLDDTYEGIEERLADGRDLRHRIYAELTGATERDADMPSFPEFQRDAATGEQT